MKGKVNGKIDISNKFTLNNDNYETKLSFNDKSIENIKEGNHLAKIIINKIIQNNKNDNDKKSKLLLSKKYQILNEYTSLFCKIKIQENISENTNHTSLFNNIFNTNNNNNQTSSLFGSPKLNTYHSLFENFNPNTNRANNQTGVLFGATNNMFLNQSQPGGLFGNTRNSTLNTTCSLFGNNDNI
jgi:hypothetical protein